MSDDRGLERSSRMNQPWHEELDEDRTFGQRLADNTARVLGSWPFIVAQTILVALWIILNVTASQSDFATNVKAETEIEDMQAHLHRIEDTLGRLERVPAVH